MVLVKSVAPGLPHAPFETDTEQFLSLDGKFHRELTKDLFTESIDDHTHGVFRRQPPLFTVKDLVFPDLGG